MVIHRGATVPFGTWQGMGYDTHSNTTSVLFDNQFGLNISDFEIQ